MSMHPLRFLAEFLKDCLSQEVQTICSSYLAGAKAGVKKDRAILAWLQEAVIGEIHKKNTHTHSFLDVISMITGYL